MAEEIHMPQSGVFYFMKGFILGQKSIQEQRYTDKGERIPITHITTSPCYLIGIKTIEKDGYNAVLLGGGVAKKMQKSTQGKLHKAGIKTPLRFLREIRLENDTQFINKEEKKGIQCGDQSVMVGDEVKTSVFFKKDDRIILTGVSKGKGFAGVVKRHHFKGGPRTHGQSDRERAPGSIGQTTTPGRVYRGKRMAGRMGGDTVTIKNVQVVESTDHTLTVKGSVPGARRGLVIIKSQKSKI